MNKAWYLKGLFVLGIIIFVFSIFADIFNGESIEIGPTQKILLIISIAVIISSFAFLKCNVDPVRLMIVFFGKILFYLEKSLKNLKSLFETVVNNKKFSKFQDSFFISIFTLFSILYTLGRWNGNTPFIFLKSDASMIAAFAAVLDNPMLFFNDFILYPLSNVQQYISVHIPIIRFLGKIFNGYGNAFLVLLPFTIFLKLFGFYNLGKKIFSDSFYGFLLAFSTLPVIYTGAWDYWGLIGDALPRNLFEIFFPWLILWSIQWNDKPKKWIIFSLILGGLTYVHAISSPIIFLSIWVTLFITSNVSLKEKIRKLIFCSITYGVLIIPFVNGYFRPKNTDPRLTYEEGLSVMRVVYESHMDLSGIITNLFFNLLRSGLLIPFVVSFLILLFLWKNRENNHARIIGGWIIGILCFTIGLTFIETQIENVLKILPLQIFFIRGTRYLPPLLVIAIYLSFFRVIRTPMKVPHPLITHVTLHTIFVLILITIFSLNLSNNNQGGYFSREMDCLLTGQITCQTSEEKDSLDIIRATKEKTLEGEVVLALPPLSVSFERSLRYEVLRPMGYNLPDISRLQSPYKIKKVIEIMEPWNLVEHAPIEEKLSSYLRLADRLGIDWLIIEKRDFPDFQLENIFVVYSNPSYLLVKVNN